MQPLFNSMINLKLILILIFLINGVAQAQTGFDLPKVISPQSEVAAYQRYGEIPVDISTGIPEIKVPLYTIESRQLQLPINISYHASGIKVNDLASTIGLGWVLNAGGIVTRTVLDQRDELGSKAHFKSKAQFEAARDAWFASPSGTASTAAQTRDNLNSLSSLLEQDYSSYPVDKQSDRFYYQLAGGESGAFRYDFLTGQLIKIPYNSAIIIKNSQEAFPHKIEGFDIIDENGNTYLFHVSEYFNQPQYEHPNSWFLSKIISADKTDTIRFTYKNFRNQYAHPIISENISWKVGWHCAVTFVDPTASHSIGGSFDASSGIPLMDSIISANSIVTFEYANDRQDGPPYRMSKMLVFEKYSEEQSVSFDFTQSYFGSVVNKNQRLRLDEVVVNKGVTEEQKYSFEYNALELPPYHYKYTPAPQYRPLYHEDFWGYYNGAANSEFALVPFQALRPAEWLGYKGNRDPNDYFAKACMLEAIKFPLGGKTTFEFERAKATFYFFSNENQTSIGGFRVKNIKSYAKEGGLAFEKSYTYGPPLVEQYKLVPEQFTSFNNSMQGIFRCEWTNEEQLKSLDGGATLTYNQSAKSEPFHPFQTIKYDLVTEYKGTSELNNGKTEYRYWVPLINPFDEGHTVEFEHPKYIHPYHWDRGDLTPRLLTKKIYANYSNSYKLLTEETNTYSAFRSTNVYSTGVHVVKDILFPGLAGDFYGNCPIGVYDNCSLRMLEYHYLNAFKYFDLKAYEEIYLPTLTTIRNYDLNENLGLIDSIFLSYENANYLKPTQQTKISSTGEQVRTEIKYPMDFVNQQPYKEMVIRNMLSPVVEQRIFKESQFLQSTKTNYTFWNDSALIKPQNVEASIGIHTPEVKIRYNDYDDFGNIISASKENDFNQVFLYNYSKTKLIAEAINVTSINQIAYTSFEDKEYGGWAASGSTILDDTSPTGDKCFQLGTLVKTGLNSSTSYILSYWYKAGATINTSNAVISDLISTPGKDGWTFVSRKITGVTTIALSGTGSIDEIRLYPANAQMSSYTYDKFSKISSECDVNNVIYYYEYDRLKRLRLIRDSNGDIFKTFKYRIRKD